MERSGNYNNQLIDLLSYPFVFNSQLNVQLDKCGNFMFKKYFFVTPLLASVIFVGGCDQQAKEGEEASAEGSEVELVSLEQRISYSIGSDLANNLKQNDIPVDVDILTQAFEEVFSGAEPRMTREEIMQANSEMTAQLQEKAQQVQAELAETSKAEGEEFLTANATKEGVVTLESGLQYKVLTEGSGQQPTAEDTVTVHYRGTLLDGSEFDSSYSRGEPASFPLGSVIRGWTEGLQLMKEGGKWEFYIPSDLAYGPGGRPPQIPPNATLKFEVELLKAKLEAPE